MSTLRFIRIQCQSCEVQLRVEYAHAGKRVRCPACQGVRRIPREDEVQDMLNFMASQQTTAMSVDHTGALPADVVPTVPPAAVAPPTESGEVQVVSEGSEIEGTDAAAVDDSGSDDQTASADPEEQAPEEGEAASQ